MKVLHIYKTYHPESYGGVETVMQNLCEGVKAQGVNSTVLALSPQHNDTISFPSYDVHRAKSLFEVASTPFSWSAVKKFRILSEQAEILHFHFPYPFADLMQCLCHNTKPTVVSYHSDIVKQSFLKRAYKPLEKWFLNRADAIVAATPNYFASSEVLQRYQDKVQVVPYGVDEAAYPDVPENKIVALRKRFGERFFLFVGALRYYKGLFTLLDAAEQVDFPIVIAGGGGEEAALKAKAKEKGLQNVHFLGRVTDEEKTALYRACYGLVFPSHLRSEAFGITLVEGLMYGKPLISCEIGTGTSYVNQSGETGFVVEPADPSALAYAMQMLWDDEKRARTMGQNARARYLSDFTQDKMCDAYSQLYQSLV